MVTTGTLRGILPPGTLPPLDPLIESFDADRKACEAKGGRWDAVNKTCTITDKEPTPLPKPVLPPVSETFTDPDTGKRTFITLPDGRSFMANEREIKALIEKDRGDVAAFAGTAEGGTAQRTAEANAAIEAEKARLAEEELPSRRELSPELTGVEKIPIIGPIAQEIGNLLNTPFRKLGIGPDISKLQPEELRSFALSEIERQEIERGLTGSEQLGKFVEATGLSRINVAGLSAKDLIETPSGNAVEVMSNIRKEKRRLTNIETNVKLNYLPVSVAREQVRNIEENVQRLSSRIRLLVSESAELKFNSDFVNTMETEILATEEKVFQSKQNILTGATQDPDEIQILQKLQADLALQEEE